MHDIELENTMFLNELGDLDYGDIYIKNGRISFIRTQENWSQVQEASMSYNLHKKLVIPGIIDPHVHFALNLGQLSSIDDFKSGSIAAAFGGVTTFIDFLDPVDNASDLEKAYYKRLEEAKDSVIDYKFHATLKNPAGNVPQIVEKMLELGITSVKVFTTYSDSGRRTYDTEIIELLQLSKIHHFTVLVHAENDELIQPSLHNKYGFLPQARPTISETSEVLKLAEYVRRYGGFLYIVHVSSGETVKALIKEYSDILHQSLFIESCPHYFLFNNSILKSKLGYLYTMAPPLRSKEEVALMRTLFENIDTIGTDHCPFSVEDKKNKLLVDMPLGIGSVEHSLEVLYSMYGLDSLQKMTSNVARIHQLPHKGMIKVGYDADLVITESGDFNIEHDHSKSDYNVYQNYESVINVVSTMAHGRFVIKDHKLLGGKGHFIQGDIK